MNSKGWIKLDRRIMDNDFLWGNGEPFDRRAAWVDLLLMAAHKDTAYCKRGQIVTSIRELAERWTWGRNRVYRFLRDTERAGMVTTSGTSSGTTITIENYSKYQSGRDTNGTPSGTTNGTPSGTQTRINNNNNNNNINNNKNKNKNKECKNDKEEGCAEDVGFSVDSLQGMRNSQARDRLTAYRKHIEEVNAKWKEN